jgi:hypothetical protein
MRITSPTRRPGLAAVRAAATLAVTAGLLLALAATPVAGKEFLQARLEAPISFDSPPGTELLVAVIVTAPEENGPQPVDGSPIWLRLIGPHGDVTEAPGMMGSGPGRYLVRIEVPDGGPRRLEVVMRGTSDLQIMVDGDPFTFKAIGAGTAQPWPGSTASEPGAAATGPAAPAPAARPVAGPQAGDPAATTPATANDAPAWLVPAAAIAGLALGGVAVLGLARSRRGAGRSSLRSGAADAPTGVRGS